MPRLIFATIVILIFFANFVFCQTNSESERFTIFKVGEPYTLLSSETASNITLIGGDARIEGKVKQDVFVFVGNVKLEPGASVEGNVTVLLGSINLHEDVQVKGQILALNSSKLLISIAKAIVGLSQSIWRSMDWVWWSLAASIVIFFIQILLISILPTYTENIFQAISERPVGTSLIGGVFMIAMVPIGLLLFYSIVGIPLLLLLWALVFAACVYGKTAISLSIGNIFLQRDRPSILAVIIGYTIYTLTTFIKWYYIGQTIFIIANVVSVGVCIRTLFGVKSISRRLKTVSQAYSVIQE